MGTKYGMGKGFESQAGVVAHPAMAERIKRGTSWIIEKYAPVPFEQVIPYMLDGVFLRHIKRGGQLYVSLREVANKLGREVALLLRPPPDWIAEIPHNNVVHQGLDHSLNQHLKGSSYTAAWYVGLTDGTPTVADTDTIDSHAGWTEVTDYDETYRQTLTLGAVSGQSVDNSASKGTFSINATVTVGGAFVISGDGGTAKGGAVNGTMYGGGAFTGGDRSLSNGDTLNVQVTFTAGTA